MNTQDSKQLTSVKVDKLLFQEFKEECLKYKFSLQKLADRAIYLYLTEEEFRQKLHNQTNIKLK
jgi:hypothetical protein